MSSWLYPSNPSHSSLSAFNPNGDCVAAFLFSFRAGETIYAVSLIPLGGYVRMTGQADIHARGITTEGLVSYFEVCAGEQVLGDIELLPSRLPTLYRRLTE